MVEFCTNCGAKLDDDSDFCSNCGTKVETISKYPFSGSGETRDEGKKDVNNAGFASMYPFSGNRNVDNDVNTGSTKTVSSAGNTSSTKKVSNTTSSSIVRKGSSTRDSSVKISNFINENDNIKVVDKKGPFTVIEYEKDLSLTPREAMIMYFSSKMNVRPRQLVTDLSKTSGVILQSGSLQWMTGSNKLSSGIKGVGDLGKKFVKSKVTGESTVKPEYAGDGYVITDKTYKHLIILDLKDFDNNLMIDDGLFLAAEKSVELTVQARTNLSSLAAGEGIFNTVLRGSGFVCLESRVPFKEIITLELNDDTVSIDGSMAIAWTSTLELTVERSAKTFVGSAISREGFVNVYRGTGRILIAPLTDLIDIEDLPNTDPVNVGLAHRVFK